jgi:acetate---CoA ligase (ADP-forming)
VPGVGDPEGPRSGRARLELTYPAHREADVVLRDGSTLSVRPVRPDDEPRLRAFFDRLSDRSRTFRFFSAATSTADAVSAALDVDHRDRFGLVATRGPDAEAVAHALYVRTGTDRAEAAFAIADEMQGHGLGTILLAHLAEAAADVGIAVLEAEVLPANHRMIEVFRESGFPIELSSQVGSIHVELPTSPSQESVDRFEGRDRIAAAAAVARFLEPGAVAVVGASRSRGTVGGEIFHNLLEAGFSGVVHPVNPNAGVVQSVRAYPSVEEVPGALDLAVIAVPAEQVSEAARGCAAKGVPALVVISAGFAETGSAGAERQRELLAICRESGMRLIGPNCLGILNTIPGVRLNATFAPAMPPPGKVGFLSQSGALGLAVIELARERALGLSSFASIGNRADVTGNDLLEYWEEDDSTSVALLYIESFSDARRFSRVARRVGARKPIVAVKSGRSRAGARATSSHTGALLEASDVTVDALFEQAGVIRADSLADLLDVASLLANQPLPEGVRVGIVTNAGGPGIMCADACEAAGLEVPGVPPAVQDELRGFLPPEASVANPVDMIATASVDHYRRAITTLAAWDGIDALIVIFVRPLLTTAEDVAEAVREALAERARPIPVQAVFMSSHDHAAMSAGGGVPTYMYPEDAARALARVVRHAAWRRRPTADQPDLGELRVAEAAGVIAQGLDSGPGWLGAEEVARLLNCYGLPVPEWRTVDDPVAAGHAAEELGGTVALKAVGPDILHKTDLGAVKVGLSGGAAVSWEAAQMDEALAAGGARRERFIVQRMVEGGVELLIGVVGDAVFGPVLACGAGGVQAEVLKDVSVRLVPVTPLDAGEMLRSLAVYPLLTGYRGAPPADLAGVEDVLLRVSAMVEAHQEIAELDLNPVVATPDRALLVDARVRVEATPPSRPWPSALERPSTAKLSSA